MIIASPKRDTACSSDRQWFVDGFREAFSTEKDALEAISMAEKYAYKIQRETLREIQNKLDEL